MRGWEENREGLEVKAGEGEERGRGREDNRSASRLFSSGEMLFACITKGEKGRDLWSVLLLLLCCRSLLQSPPGTTGVAAQESSRAAAKSAQKPSLPSPGSCGKQAEGSLPLLLSPMGRDEWGGCFQAAPELAPMVAQAKGWARVRASEEDEQDGRMQLHGESRTLRRLAAQMGPIALGLDVNTSSLTSFSNHIF